MKWKFLAIASLTFLSAESVFLFARAASLRSTLTTTPAVYVLSENSYRWYGNIDGLDPVVPLASEGAATSTPDAGSQIRLRMNVGNTGGAVLSSGAAFILQYANSTSGPWTDVSTSTAWSFFDNPSVADGQIIVNLLLGASNVGESYGESNPSAAMPTQLLPGDYGEWDWSLVNVSATTTANWFFRMESALGTPLDAYSSYPKLAAVPPPPPPPPPSGGGPVFQVGAGGSTGYVSTSSVPPTQKTSTLPVAPPLLPPRFQVADFNGDNRIDITDLSILLYYYEKSGPTIARYDLNNDGSVDFPDVSILMYYWTSNL